MSSGCTVAQSRLGSFGDEEAGEVPDEGDARLDGRVGTDVGAGSPGTFPGTDEVIAEQAHGRPQRFGGAVDSALPTSGGEPGVLVEAEGEVVGDEELLEGAGQRPRRSGQDDGTVPAAPAGGRLAVGEQAARRR